MGSKADLCVFDLHNIHERGSYQHPAQTAAGMTAVYVNGCLAVENGQLTGAKAGQIIRR